MEREFAFEIIDHMNDYLADHEGCTCYACDLASEMTMNENYDGCWIVYTARAVEFIKAHWDAARDTFEYFKSELDMTPNPFENPEAYTFFMLDWGVREMLTGNEFLDEHWSEQIEITDEVRHEIMDGIMEEWGR